MKNSATISGFDVKQFVIAAVLILPIALAHFAVRLLCAFAVWPLDRFLSETNLS